MSTTAAACPRCDTRVAVGQEYCLGCGLRLGRDRVGGGVGRTPFSWRSVALLGAVAIAGGAVAIAATRDPASTRQIITATGGSETVRAPAVAAASRLAVWPRARTAWTVILVSVPKARGRQRAVAIARRARESGLTRVGVLDSARFASLRPGSWMVFAGVYESQPEAAGAIRRARTVTRSARTQRIVP